MPCNHPLTAFWTGSITPLGKREYVIGKTGDEFYEVKPGMPFSFEAPHAVLGGRIVLTDPLPVPCGHCVGCRMEKAKEWKVRCCLEALDFSPGELWFLTLTYDDCHLPVDSNGQPYLKKSDLTKFWKRLRKYSGERFRYFACGEYGELFHRPHFHAIIFGNPFKDAILDIYHRGQFASPLLSKCWPFGNVLLMQACTNHMAYVAGYVEKKQSDPDWYSYPVPPYVTMSRRPGIGSSYIVTHEDSVLITGKVYGPFTDKPSEYSNTFKIPRSFFKKLEERFPDWAVTYKENNVIQANRQKVLEDCIYDTTDVDSKGFMKDNYMKDKLEKLRKAKL